MIYLGRQTTFFSPMAWAFLYFLPLIDFVLQFFHITTQDLHYMETKLLVQFY